MHHQRALHAHGAAVAAVNTLYFAGNQAVADIVQPSATVAFNGGAQEAHATELVHDFTVKFFVASRHQNAGLQFFLAKVMSRIDDGSLVLAQLFVQQKGVVPLKGRLHD